MVGQVRPPLVGLSVLLAGCGPGWEAVPGGTGRGYDVYRPEPYLLVLAGPPSRGGTTRPAGPQQYVAHVVYLPDYSTRYRVRSTSGGTNLYIKDGWELSAVSDQNNLSNLLSTAVSGATSGAGGAGSALDLLGLIGGPPLSANGPGDGGTGGDDPASTARRNVTLYKLVFGPDGRVSGLVRVGYSDPVATPSRTLADHNPPVVPIPGKTD